MSETAPTATETAAGFVAKAFSSRSFLVGFVITSIVALMAIVSFFWVPYDVTVLPVADRMKTPSATHLLGTDHFGRDILSMIMVGSRNSIAVALVCVTSGSSVGGRRSRRTGRPAD